MQVPMKIRRENNLRPKTFADETWEIQCSPTNNGRKFGVCLANEMMIWRG